MKKINELTIEEIYKFYNEGFRFDINNGAITVISVIGITSLNASLN